MKLNEYYIFSLYWYFIINNLVIKMLLKYFINLNFIE